MRPAGIQLASATLRRLARVKGRHPLARRETFGALENVNLRHVSAGAPVIAQTDGKSLAASCDAQTTTRSVRLGGGVEAKQLVQAAVEAHLGGHPADRQQHTWHVGFSARRPM